MRAMAAYGHVRLVTGNQMNLVNFDNGCDMMTFP